MTFEDANKISIKGYLAEQGISPVKEGGYYGMYRCPFRTDNEASMKVDYATNLWYDHGTSEGGTFVDLVMKMEQCTAYQAITRIESEHRTFESFSFQGKEDMISASVEVSIQKVQPLQNRALLDYICGERKINRDVAKRHLQEIYYSVKDKYYYSVAFPSDGGGYELRNAYFKGCIAPKEITVIRNSLVKHDTCLVFEGFMDYLSYLTLKEQVEVVNRDVVVLNSTSLVKQMIARVPAYDRFFCFLDNDNAGCQALFNLQKEYSFHILDQSVHYSDCNDLNDFLCNKKIKKEQTVILSKKGDVEQSKQRKGRIM